MPPGLARRPRRGSIDAGRPASAAPTIPSLGPARRTQKTIHVVPGTDPRLDVPDGRNVLRVRLPLQGLAAEDGRWEMREPDPWSSSGASSVFSGDAPSATSSATSAETSSASGSDDGESIDGGSVASEAPARRPVEIIPQDHVSHVLALIVGTSLELDPRSTGASCDAGGLG